MDVRAKTAVITGASRGIGKQVAIELGRRGANVVVAARTAKPIEPLVGTIDQTAEEVQAAGAQVMAIRTDLTDTDDIDHLVSATVERFGGVDILVNNAAATMSPIAIDRAGGLDELAKDPEETPPDMPSITALARTDWLRQFDTNLHAPFYLIQAVVPSMRDRGGGIIVNLTSGAADLSPLPPSLSDALATEAASLQDFPDRTVRVTRIPDRLGYAASKAALNRLANVVAAELRDLGIAVITVDPGGTRNELVELMHELGIVDAGPMHPLYVPVRTIVHLITCDDPMAYTGSIQRAADLYREKSLEGANHGSISDRIP